VISSDVHHPSSRHPHHRAGSARTEEWRRDFVRSAFAAEQADRDAVKDERHLYLMGEFALVLAAYGVLVDDQTLQRLAYVAVGGA
jgi:hypothetical protein